MRNRPRDGTSRSDLELLREATPPPPNTARLGVDSGLSSAIGVTNESRVRYVGPGRRADGGGPKVWLFLCGGMAAGGSCGSGKSGIAPMEDTVDAREEAILLGAADCGGDGS